MRDVRRRARARASAEPGANKDHSCTGQRLANLFCRFESGLIANFGVAACAQAAGDRATELHFVRSNRACQRLHVGVNRQDLGSLQSIEHDPVERVETGAANADNFDWNRVLPPLGEAVVFAKLNHIDLSIFHLLPLKILPRIRPNPRAGRSVCTAWAYLINPIAVENCGFSTAAVTPEVV